MHRDSLDKIICTYFAGVTRVAFTWNGESFRPKPLTVSPDIFRGFTCPAGCGGCCPRFSLVYLPDEPQPPALARRLVTFAGRTVEIRCDAQEEGGHFCRHLSPLDGRCGIHGQHPFSCDFELLRFSHFADSVALSTRLYGRGWNLLRIVDNERGALCTITPRAAANRSDVLRKIERLRRWCEHFRLPHRLSEVARYVATGPHTEAVTIA